MYNSMQLDNSKLTLKMQVGYFILQCRYKDYVSESLYFFSNHQRCSACPVIKVITIMLLSLFKRNEHLFHRHSEISVLYFAF